MNRRTLLRAGLGASVAVFGAAGAGALLAQGGTGSLRRLVPGLGRIRVAFMLGDWANVIDTFGPWEVFQDVTVGPLGAAPFELYTVAPREGALRMTGGLTVLPHYTIANAPAPKVIVVPAHRSTPESLEWLRQASAGTDVTMSVCTGAFQLARAGLLKGLTATTHHDFWDSFDREFPDVKLERGLRFVDNGRIATAGGLTSGIDMALHVVARYFGEDTAARTAEYMEYQSTTWRQAAGGGRLSQINVL